MNATERIYRTLLGSHEGQLIDGLIELTSLNKSTVWNALTRLRKVGLVYSRYRQGEPTPRYFVFAQPSLRSVVIGLVQTLDESVHLDTLLDFILRVRDA